MSRLLELENVVVRFPQKTGMASAVRGVSMDIQKGETLVVLGESGSGKSVMLRSILQISPPGTQITGSIRLDGTELIGSPLKLLRDIRGNRVAMIFQDSLSALDPLYRVGAQIEETIRAHRKTSRAEAKAEVVELFRQVGIPSPESRVRSYPHEMSGGMRQRAVIAMALACKPDILLADEPTTALDVTVQAQILQLFRTIQRTYGMSIVMVTHDIGVAVEMADRIAVIYAGKIVETGEARQVLTRPAHPYTQGLIGATLRKGQTGSLATIPGQPPAISNMPAGCAFAERCPQSQSACRLVDPELIDVDAGHRVACVRYDGSEADRRHLIAQ